MRIDFEKMKKKGFIVHQKEGFVEIYPASGVPMAKEIGEKFGIMLSLAFDLEERIHKYQILTALSED